MLSDESHQPPSSPAPTAETVRQAECRPILGTPGFAPEGTAKIASEPALPLPNPDRIDAISGLLPDGFHPLDPRQIALDRFGNLIFSLVLLAGLLVAAVVLWLVRGTDWIWCLVLGGGGLLVGSSFWSGIAWPPVEHRHRSWRLDETGLEIRRGVFWKNQISVPLARLQHADLAQGPLQRRYGLARLTIHTAGTENASVELGGLAMETATWLRDQLIRQRGAGDVV